LAKSLPLSFWDLRQVEFGFQFGDLIGVVGIVDEVMGFP
jgi:hypothetical protein